ncbi:hypothetical protein LX32DRAFT_691340 [Colletotrichum zoysiae]|uniref:Uncharacterized protein n=1 Tax=Colletotrichum zoysiae TaxID=1216348 RepID=A0AAD9M4R2_9PEZI|nr:hypothetical protein LX32DRAFT_691340 [Colletotrichum zoysiae]
MADPTHGAGNRGRSNHREQYRMAMASPFYNNHQSVRSLDDVDDGANKRIASAMSKAKSSTEMQLQGNDYEPLGQTRKSKRRGGRSLNRGPSAQTTAANQQQQQPVVNNTQLTGDAGSESLERGRPDDVDDRPTKRVRNTLPDLQEITLAMSRLESVSGSPMTMHIQDDDLSFSANSTSETVQQAMAKKEYDQYGHRFGRVITVRYYYEDKRGPSTQATANQPQPVGNNTQLTVDDGSKSLERGRPDDVERQHSIKATDTSHPDASGLDMARELADANASPNSVPASEGGQDNGDEDDLSDVLFW